MLYLQVRRVQLHSGVKNWNQDFKRSKTRLELSGCDPFPMGATRSQVWTAKKKGQLLPLSATRTQWERPVLRLVERTRRLDLAGKLAPTRPRTTRTHRLRSVPSEWMVQISISPPTYLSTTRTHRVRPVPKPAETRHFCSINTRSLSSPDRSPPPQIIPFRQKTPSTPFPLSLKVSTWRWCQSSPRSRLFHWRSTHIFSSTFFLLVLVLLANLS